MQIMQLGGFALPAFSGSGSRAAFCLGPKPQTVSSFIGFGSWEKWEAIRA